MNPLKLTTTLALTLTAGILAQETPLHAPDGGTRQHLESIVIPATPNAPFSATVVTEWTHIAPDGGTIVTSNHRTVARDNSGRVFQERRYFSPHGDKQTTALSELDYDDPNRHELTVCRPDTRVCTTYQHDAPSIAALPNVGPLPNGMGMLSREDLGRKTIDNLNTLGSREITTLNTGAIGNNQPEPIIKEFWYSPALGINLVTKRFDPRASASQDFEVKDVSLAEPDARLFIPPAAYRLVRMGER